MKKKRVETNHLIIRLCLITVKRFPENTYFSEMLIFGKGKCFHVFGCISKKFSEKIFWCLEKKKENTNSEKHKPQPRSRHPTTAIRDHDRRIFIWDLAIFLDGSSSWISRPTYDMSRSRIFLSRS